MGIYEALIAMLLLPYKIPVGIEDIMLVITSKQGLVEGELESMS